MAKILIAEDRDINIMLLKAMLGQLVNGAEISVAANGREAFELASQQNFDIIFMDVNMPEMDGLEATQKIRTREGETGNHAPIIALTAATSDDEIAQYKNAGMDDFLPKPIIMDDLQEKINQYLLS